MTIVVPFDGSDLSAVALVRATDLGEAFGEDVLAVTVVPENNAEYARERDWLGPDEEFHEPTVAGRIRERVADLAPEADFRHVTVGRYAPSGTIAAELRRLARAENASLVAVGSDNAGHLVTSIRSVGGSVAADEAFDVLIVRRTVPTDAVGDDARSW